MFSCAGIDVSKDSLEVWINSQGIGASFPNSASGFPVLIDWLKGFEVTRVLLEATGGYERGPMKVLQRGGFDVLRNQSSSGERFCQGNGLSR
ncbi:transposase [Pseudomonas sp. FP603]|uniref:transposase n=1 Tax=Pseudomonas sp. FP603 TaxID=2954097 RepID=UPI0027353CD0|nr:transposase [Pseudomonas sp. FP603]WLI10158.1 transposase [Pseudomonas sp. FP603]